MKRLFFNIFLLFPYFLFAQEINESKIEVWGLTDISKEEFLYKFQLRGYELNQYSLNRMGFPDANLLTLSNGITLITLRANPAYDFSPQTKEKREFEISPFWQKIIKSRPMSIEAQTIPGTYHFYKNDERDKMAEEISKNMTFYHGYNMPFNDKKVLQYCHLLDEISTHVTLEEVRDILYHSNDKKLLQAATFASIAFINSHENALKFLPFIYDPSTQMVFNGIIHYYQYYKPQTDWGKDIGFVAKILNHPDPMHLVNMIYIFSITGFDPILMPQLFANGSDTMLELLQSDLIKEEKKKLLIFLKDNPEKSFGNNNSKWVTYIQTFRKKDESP